MAQPPPYPGSNLPYPKRDSGPDQVRGSTGGGGFSAYGSDVEGGAGGYQPPYDDNLGAFSDKSIRAGFVRKVFGILSVQLFVTVGIAAPFVASERVKLFAHQNSWLAILVMVTSLVLVVALSCCESVRRKQPLNYILLGMFTVCEGFMVGLISSTYDVEAVFIAIIICACLTVGLTLFAMQTKIDFVSFGGVAFVALIVLMVGGLLLAFFPSRLGMIIYASLGSLIFAFYLIYDIQLMVGGKHSYAIDPEDYVFAALSIYLDVINLFLMLLRLIGAIRGD